MPQDYQDFDRLDFASNYRTHNPIIRHLLDRFYVRLEKALQSQIADASSALEVGAGEGYSTSIITEVVRAHRGKLFVSDLIPELMLRNKTRSGEANLLVQDIMKLAIRSGEIDVVVALEVFEHLPDPRLGLREIARVARRSAVISVPFEPWWRLGNIARGAYLRDLGNTPDHVNHWGRKSFTGFLLREFAKVEVTVSFPWLIGVCELPRKVSL
ncbi:MAG TPA: class I SAM-dependent methyltransferase [Bacteroidetes bacterium]|nr:class I SAM-dependent methyltransferase [Bacteroidota bacterium]